MFHVHLWIWTRLIMSLIHLSWFNRSSDDDTTPKVPGSPRGYRTGHEGSRQSIIVPPLLARSVTQLRLPESVALRLALLAFPTLPSIWDIETMPAADVLSHIGTAAGFLDPLEGVPNIHIRQVMSQAFGLQWNIMDIFTTLKVDQIDRQIEEARRILDV